MRSSRSDRLGFAACELALPFPVRLIPMRLDHTLVCASDLPSTISFYQEILGLRYRGRSGRFEVIEVDEHLVFDFVESERCRGRHFAFSMPRSEFDAVFDRIRRSGMPFGDRPGAADSMRGPGRSSGARGATLSVYFHDPNGHLLEIVSYESARAESESRG